MVAAGQRDQPSSKTGGRYASGCAVPRLQHQLPHTASGGSATAALALPGWRGPQLGENSKGDRLCTGVAATPLAHEQVQALAIDLSRRST
jgi:hypothetical protein